MRKSLGGVLARALTLTGLPLMAAAAAVAEAPRVAADIAPIHSIAARVMAGIGAPELVVPPGASPHGYALRPSEARALQEADLVVWVGPALTPWIADLIDTLAAPAAIRLVLEDTPGMNLLPARSGNGFGADGDDHDQGDAPVDGHLWLDPENATVAARAVATALGGLDPANAAAYAANAEAFAAELATLAAAIDAELAPVRGRPWIVFHDAFGYFEDAFAIPAADSVVVQEGVEPGAARVAAIRARVESAGIACAFTAPQFAPDLLDTIVEGTGARIGAIDDLGAGLPPGPGLYPALLRGIADGLRACLSPS